MRKTLFASVICLFGALALQACNDSGETLTIGQHTIHVESGGMVTDDNGVTCKTDDGNWADCYQETYKSSCKNGKAVVCGNSYTNFEVFEFDCDCKMVDGKATCGQCTPGEIDTSVAGTVKICNPAGLWEEQPYRIDHPDELKPCDPNTYRAKCDGDVALECSELTGRIYASKCNSNIYSENTCVEVDDKLEEAEFNQYKLVCEETVHRAYCSYCKPGQVAETGTVCLSSRSPNAAPVVCSEYGFWIDKETGDIPKYGECESECYQGQCLGKLVPCTEDAMEGNVCFTEDSFSRTRLWCDIYGKWFNNNEPLDLEYCAKGCRDNVCYN